MAEFSTFRRRVFTAVGIAAGVVIAIFLLIFGFREKKPAVDRLAPPAEVAETPVAVAETLAPPPLASPAPPEEPEDAYLRQLARIFLERYGSFSNQNDNRHIDDVLALSTRNMRNFLESKRQMQSLSYQGMTTRVVAAGVSERAADRATITAGVQQIVKDGVLENTKYATARVELLRVSGEWKVDGVYFEAS